MTRVFSSPNGAEVGLLRGLLEAEGIPCSVRNDRLSIAAGGVPVFDCWPELWVLDEDAPRAQGIINLRDAPPTSFAPWNCAACGELNEGQFAACWKCGAADVASP